MVAITYAELLATLQELSADNLQCHVTVEIGGEYFPIYGVTKVQDDAALDNGHPVLMTQDTPQQQ